MKDPCEKSTSNILQAAIDESLEKGFDVIRRAEVATRAGVSNALVTHYFGDMDTLKDSVMRWAVSNQNLDLIVQGIVKGNSIALAANSELRKKAINQLHKK